MNSLIETFTGQVSMLGDVAKITMLRFLGLDESFKPTERGLLNLLTNDKLDFNASNIKYLIVKIAIFLLVLLQICCQIVVCIFYDLNYIIIFVFL